MRLNGFLIAAAMLSGLAMVSGCQPSGRTQEARATAERFVAAWKVSDRQTVKSLLHATWLDVHSPDGMRVMTVAEADKLSRALIANQKALARDIESIGKVVADPWMSVAEVRLRKAEIGAHDQCIGYTTEQVLLVLRPSVNGWKVDFIESRFLWSPYSSGQLSTSGIKTAEWIEDAPAPRPRLE